MPMNYGKALLAAFLLLSLSLNSCAKGDPYAREMRSAATYSALTSANHPRLFADDEEFARIREAVLEGGNPMLSRLHERVMQIAESDGQSPDTLVAKLDASNMRLLAVCRLAVTRIFSAAYAYRFTGEERFLRHAEWDINTVCDFKSWNPTHFLDVGEMSTGVALGYDWLYAHLADSTKAKAVRAVEELSFAQARDTSNAWFYRSIHNWNQVCNGGLICAAMAMYENFPEAAREVVAKGVESNRKAMRYMYEPDGAYPEGPGYWNYGNTFQSLLQASLESCLGTDFGLADEPGFQKTGEYEIFTQGNTNRVFNYYDNSAALTPHASLWYMAARFNRPDYLYFEEKQLMETPYASGDSDRLLPLFLVYASRIDPATVNPSEKECYFGNGVTPIAMVRTGWEKDDLYLGVHGGSASSNHGHVDCGTFVYDAYGVRWASETDPLGYARLENPIKERGGYLWDRKTQSSWRWKLFRYHNLQHNTLTVNDSTHNILAFAPMIGRYDEPDRMGAAFDLTKLFWGDLSKAVREVSIRDRSYLQVIDRLQGGPADAKVRWTLVSEAVPEVTPSGILLRADGKSVLLEVTIAASGPETALAAHAAYHIYPSDPAEAGFESADFEPPVSQHICGFEFTVPAGESLGVITTLKRVE